MIGCGGAAFEAALLEGCPAAGYSNECGMIGLAWAYLL